MHLGGIFGHKADGGRPGSNRAVKTPINDNARRASEPSPSTPQSLAAAVRHTAVDGTDARNELDLTLADERLAKTF